MLFVALTGSAAHEFQFLKRSIVATRKIESFPELIVSLHFHGTLIKCQPGLGVYIHVEN